MSRNHNNENCRICFNNFSEMQELRPFLPLIRIVANTKLHHAKDESPKICKSCANGLILANLFRVKVIESNAKYRDLLSSKKLTDTQKSIQQDHGSLVLEVEEEDHMDYEALDEYVDDSVQENEKVEEKVIRTPKVSPKVNVTMQAKQKIQELKEKLKLKIIGNGPEHFSKSKKLTLICFTCTEPSEKLNPVTPFIDTLNRIVSVGKINKTERLCDRCMQKLKLSKTFFAKLSAAMVKDIRTDCCQFCSCSKNDLISTSKGPFEIFNSLPKFGFKSRTHYNGKTCLTCVQILNKIKTIRHGYLSKGKFLEAAPNIKKLSHKEQLITKIMAEAAKECRQKEGKPKSEKIDVTPVKANPKVITVRPDAKIRQEMPDTQPTLEKQRSETEKTDVRIITVKPDVKVITVMPDFISKLQKSDTKPKQSLGQSAPVVNPQSNPRVKASELREYLRKQCENADSTPEVVKKFVEVKQKSPPEVPAPRIDLSKCDNPKRALISRIMADTPLSEIDDDKVKTPLMLGKRPKKRIRIRAEPRYVLPDSSEPLPEDYQCHMSDFEELDSDSEVPPVIFRTPLNVPFEPKYLKCSTCDARFINSFELEGHMECIHQTTTNTCNFCNNTYKDASFVKAHKLRVHFGEFSIFDNKMLCDICGTKTSRFEDHMSSFHLNVRPFKCKQCDYAGITKMGLKNHISAIHLGEKRYKCNYCDKRFSYGADRGRHEIGVHTKKFKHICQFCGKCCLKKNFLTAHMRSHHPDHFYEES